MLAEKSESNEPIRGRRRPRRSHFILIAVLALLLVFSSYFTYLTVSLPDVEPLVSRNPEMTALMELRFGEGQDKREQEWRPLDQISERLVQAVVMAEDAGFYHHNGFDFYEIRESIRRNLREGHRARGASTITQQLAKNLYLSTEKTLQRKLKEAILARRLERHLSKNRILELYLNVIEWGDGIYGAEAASREYFGKPAAELDAAEAAFLAAMIPNPRYYQPSKRYDSLKRRQERILDWMHMAGHLDDDELKAAARKRLPLTLPSPQGGEDFSAGNPS